MTIKPNINHAMMNRILSYLKRTQFLNKKNHHRINREISKKCSEIAFVEFWFYSDTETSLHKMATHLVQNGYTISVCESNDDGSGFLCMALSKIDPDPDEFDRLVIYLQIMAELFNTELDGWLRS